MKFKRISVTRFFNANPFLNQKVCHARGNIEFLCCAALFLEVGTCYYWLKMLLDRSGSGVVRTVFLKMFWSVLPRFTTKVRAAVPMGLAMVPISSGVAIEWIYSLNRTQWIETACLRGLLKVARMVWNQCFMYNYTLAHARGPISYVLPISTHPF